MRASLNRYVAGMIVILSWVLSLPLLEYILYITPKLVYRFESQSIKSECASIHVGMSSGQVIETFNRTSTPQEQNISGRRAVFGTMTGACYVEFGDDGFVSGVRLDRPLWQ
jgi:hypothetical protein